jgi:hypothetical protein
MKVSSDVFLGAPRWAGPACIFSTLEYLGRCAPRDIGSNADAVTPWNLARSEKNHLNRNLHVRFAIK